MFARLCGALLAAGEAAAAEADAERLALARSGRAARGYRSRVRDEAVLMYGKRRAGGPTWETLQRRRLFVLYLLWPVVLILAIALAVAAVYLYY